MHLPDQRPGSSSDTRDDFAESPSESVSCSVMSNSLQSYGLQPARLLCLWNSPSKTTGVGSHSLLQRIFRTQGLNPGSLASQTDYFFLFFFLYLFQLEDKYFTILWWFLPYIDMNQPQVYMCPPSQTPLPPPFPSHPSGLSQCTGFECPVSCIELGLVIYFTYDNIHVSMLFSQIIPPLPSPTESKSLFFIAESLLLSRIQGHLYHLYKFHI